MRRKLHICIYIWRQKMQFLAEIYARQCNLLIDRMVDLNLMPYVSTFLCVILTYIDFLSVPFKFNQTMLGRPK